MKLLNNHILVSCDGYIKKVRGISTITNYETAKASPARVILEQIDDISSIRQGMFCSGFTCDNPEIKVGDTLIVDWYEIDKALNEPNLQHEGKYLIPYDAIVGVEKNGSIAAMNGNIIFTDMEQKLDHNRGLVALPNEYRYAKAVSVSNIHAFCVDKDGEEVWEEVIKVKEGDTIWFDHINALDIEADGFVSTDIRYSYIRSFHIIMTGE